ncbi:MAG TPA: hypothetical protein VNV66_13550 [Pilimelia sp.]|nr:hypothetical protein [Pilimelia sp.]
MSKPVRWWARLGALWLGLCVALAAPTVAWAAQRPAVLATAEELARRRPRFPRGLGIVGALCCLFVVAAIIAGVVLLARRRRR